MPEKYVSLSFEVPHHHHSISHGTKMLTQLDWLDPDPMQAENADSAWIESIPDLAGYVCA